MILIEGPYAELANAMLDGVLGKLRSFDYDMQHVAHDPRPKTMKQMISLIQSDHRYEIHTGIVAPGFDARTRYMFSYGLSTAGSCLVICGGKPNESNVLPTVMVDHMSDVPRAITDVLAYWEVSRTW